MHLEWLLPVYKIRVCESRESRGNLRCKGKSGGIKEIRGTFSSLEKLYLPDKIKKFAFT